MNPQIEALMWSVVIFNIMAFFFGAIFGISWEKHRSKFDKDE